MLMVGEVIAVIVLEPVLGHPESAGGVNLLHCCRTLSDEKCLSKDFVEPPLIDNMITVQFIFGSQGASGDFFFSC